MKKIPCLFVRDFAKRPATALDEVTPGCEWVIAGEGVATRKFDGTAALIRDGRIFARYDCKRGKTPPAGWEACDVAPDPVTGHWPGWIAVQQQNEYRWHAQALAGWVERCGVVPADGTYEVIGPKVGGNPERVDVHMLVRHGGEWFSGLKRTFDGIRSFLSVVKIEGLVFHHNDGRMAKIRRPDFGLPWPVEDPVYVRRPARDEPRRMVPRQEICERIRFLFDQARESGADTDSWLAGPDVVDDICSAAWEGCYRVALEIVERAPDPRWERLRWYLHGLGDAAAQAR